jgi:hypothetical protein
MLVLLFLSVYPALSAQYFLWAVPLAALGVDRWTVAHGLACTLGLAGFYLFLAPGVLTPAAGAPGPWAAGVLWAAGAAAAWMAGIAWLASAAAREGGVGGRAV